MKKLILLFLLLVLKFAPAKAQWVTIPDSNFVNKLTQLYPSCMDGNQMDTTCEEIVNATDLALSNSNISNLSGIEYFVSLANLSCSYNEITSISVLPSFLISLNCSDNYLISLPVLPNSLSQLFCSNNLINNLQTLPDSLTNLSCFNNPINNLPPLPNTLTFLDCGEIQISTLPDLPNSLTYLRCDYNQLTNLPILPSSLTYLNCSYNQLTTVPSVPNVMSTFIVNDNNISCLSYLPQANGFGDISNNPLSCVPNQRSYSLNLPLCMENDSINNPNNCIGLNIGGILYQDIDSNCYPNPSDIFIQNVPVKLYDSQNNFLAQSYTINGVYGFNILLPDTYQVKIDTINLLVGMACGQSSTRSVILTSANQTIQNINFPVVCNSAYDVLVQSVTPQGWVFPGQIHTFQTNVTNNSNWYNLQCDTNIYSGTVSIQVNGPVSFVAPTAWALTPIVSGNTYTYNIANFNTLNSSSFGLEFLTDTTAQATDQICVHVEITPNPIDADTTNNVYDFCYNVVNS
jgi:Leucine-rich repeat (LRR) protein